MRETNKASAIALIVTLGLISIVRGGLYNPINSYLTVLNQKNFDTQVTNNRAKGISIVHFYKEDDIHSKGMAGQLEVFAKENKGMFRVGAVSCDEFPKICEKERVSKVPTVRIYPQFPAPTVDYEEDTFDTGKLKKMAAKFITSKVIEITQNNIDTFIGENPGTPKVLYFTDKKGTPLIYKALSSNFDKTLLFGIVRDTETNIVNKYKVKSFPTIFLTKHKEDKPIKYEGTDFSYQGIFDFINIYSETFVFNQVNEDEVKSSAAKPWLSERVPQLTSESANDICLKKEGVLCVIYIAKNEASKDQETLDLLYNVGQAFSSKISRGISFNFMWLDASQEKDFASIFEVEEQDLPKVVILNPGKRKRFLLHEKPITEADLSDTLDKILGGDARFTNIKGNQLPELVTKYPTK